MGLELEICIWCVSNSAMESAAERWDEALVFCSVGTESSAAASSPGRQALHTSPFPWSFGVVVSLQLQMMPTYEMGAFVLETPAPEES